jgi:hypothetical protein
MEPKGACFRATYCLHLQVQRIGQASSNQMELCMENMCCLLHLLFHPEDRGSTSSEIPVNVYRLHDFMSHKTVFFIVTAVSTSNPKHMTMLTRSHYWTLPQESRNQSKHLSWGLPTKILYKFLICPMHVIKNSTVEVQLCQDEWTKNGQKHG